MTSAAELAAQTACADLQRQLDAERVCNRNHLARIGRLNALLVTYERERDAAEATIERLEAENAKLRAELVFDAALTATDAATITALRAELAEARKLEGV
jgi:hypothetical protein